MNNVTEQLKRSTHTHSHTPSTEAPTPAPAPPQRIDDIFQVAQTAYDISQHKIKAKRIEIANISVKACIHPLCDGILHGQGPLEYGLKQVLITDVGMESNGVTLLEFAEIFVRAILMSVVKSAPEQIRLNLVRILGDTLYKK